MVLTSFRKAMIPNASPLIVLPLFSGGIDGQFWQQKIIPHSLAANITRTIRRREDIWVENGNFAGA